MINTLSSVINNKKHLLIVSNYYPPLEIGGYEQLCHDISNLLAADCFIVKVLTSNYKLSTRLARILDETSDENPSISRLLRLMPNPESKLHYIVQFFLTRRFTERMNLSVFERAIREFKPDIIFFWNLQHLPRSLAIMAESLAIPTVYWLAGYTPAEPDEFWQFWMSNGKSISMRVIKPLINKFGLKLMKAEGKPEGPRMSHVAVVSEYMLQKGLKDCTLPTSANVIYNGVEYEKFFYPPRQSYHNPITLLQAGTVCFEKGVHVSIEAIRILLQQYVCPKLLLLIAGDGPTDYVAYINKLIYTYNLQNNVKMLGRFPRDQMPGLLRNSDILLLPTIKDEPLARVTQEALASGMIVIASNTGGTSELIINGKTGLLYEPGDISGFTDLIYEVLTNTHLGAKLATNGQKFVRNTFTLDRMYKDIKKMIINSMDENKTLESHD